jgi:hypothetical protein
MNTEGSENKVGTTISILRDYFWGWGYHVSRYHVSRYHVSRYHVSRYHVSRYHVSMYHVSRYHVSRYHVSRGVTCSCVSSHLHPPFINFLHFLSRPHNFAFHLGSTPNRKPRRSSVYPSPSAWCRHRFT